MSNYLTYYLDTPNLRHIEEVCGRNSEQLTVEQYCAFLHCVTFSMLEHEVGAELLDETATDHLLPELDLFDELRLAELEAILEWLAVNQIGNRRRRARSHPVPIT